MISVSQSLQKINAVRITPEKEEIGFRQSLGRITAAPIKADRDLPSFDRSLMDGIAIKFKDYRSGLRSYTLSGTVPAGSPAPAAISDGSCVEIMTGAELPGNCDTVLPIEWLNVTADSAHINKGRSVKKGQFIRRKGSDHKKGTVLIPKASRISPTEITVAAAVGQARVSVFRRPAVHIVSSGDELKNVTSRIKHYQIRKSNSYFIESILNSWGIGTGKITHFLDDKRAIIKGMKQIAAKSDIVILTGGVSAGKFDHIPAALQEIGVRKLFHKVSQKPGKPFWFGRMEQTVFFALPGNPVSTQVCTRRYVIPFIYQKYYKYALPEHSVVLTAKCSVPKGLTYFCPVKVRQDTKGVRYAKPVNFSGSGDFASLAGSDGFIEIPERRSSAIRGDIFQFFPWVNV